MDMSNSRKMIDSFYFILQNLLIAKDFCELLMFIEQIINPLFLNLNKLYLKF